LRSEIPQEPQLPMLENGSGAVGWSSSLSPISSDSGFVSVSKLWAELQRETHHSLCFQVLTGAGAWWDITVIPAVGRQRREDHEFYASLGCRVRPCLKQTNKNL
jgi:hypothetical protein